MELWAKQDSKTATKSNPSDSQLFKTIVCAGLLWMDWGFLMQSNAILFHKNFNASHYSYFYSTEEKCNINWCKRIVSTYFLNHLVFCFVFALQYVTCYYLHISFSLCLKFKTYSLELKGFILKCFPNPLPGNCLKLIRTSCLLCSSYGSYGQFRIQLFASQFHNWNITLSY